LFRFSIRDVLWLTVVVALALGWWAWWQRIPRTAKQVAGSIVVTGKPLADGRLCLHSVDGQIVGARVINGQFRIQHVPIGTFRVAIEGNGVATKYSDDTSEVTIQVKEGVN
jgi:hypothetical protein